MHAFRFLRAEESAALDPLVGETVCVAWLYAVHVIMRLIALLATGKEC